MSEWYEVQAGTPEEARGDYEHDLQKQREVDAMKTYRVILKHESYYGFDVYAHTRAEAMQLAHNRMDGGDWGREECGEVNIFDLEETK